MTVTNLNPYQDLAREKRARRLALVSLATALRHATPLDALLIALSDPSLPLRAAIAEAAQVDSPSDETWENALGMIRLASERTGR